MSERILVWNGLVTDFPAGVDAGRRPGDVTDVAREPGSDTDKVEREASDVDADERSD